jgi:hypothetical protein
MFTVCGGFTAAWRRRPLVSLSATSSDTARPVAVRLSQPPRRPTPDRAGRDGRPGTRELDKKMKYNGKTV